MSQPPPLGRFPRVAPADLATLAAVATVLVAAAFATPARAIVADSAATGAIALPAAAAPDAAPIDLQRALEAAPAWQAFRARYGDWHAEWNGATRSPHRAAGPSIPLAGFADDSASVDAGVQAFVGAHPELFGAGTVIEPRAIRRHGRVWYATYRQVVDGLAVLFADWEFRVSVDGRLMMFGADAWPVQRPALPARIATAAAGAAATAGIAFTPGRDVVSSAGPAALLPFATAAGATARVVLPLRILAEQPLANWLALVDATTGEVLLRTDRARHVTGHVTGLVHPTLPTDPLTPRPFTNAYVMAGTDTVATDTTGRYVLPGLPDITVSAEIRGRFADVSRVDVSPPGTGDAHFSATAQPGFDLDIPWGDVGFSHDGERDAYYNANVVHDHLKRLDPGLTALDFEVPYYVNYPYGHCNAVWTGFAIYMFSAGNGCVNSATAPSVLHHEYGHAVNDAVYEASGIEFGMQNSALHEGMADIYGAFLDDEPLVGRGFYGPGSFVRNIENTLRWPEDEVMDPHATGGIVAGAFWDLRQAVGLAIAERLSHQAKYGHPDDVHDGTAFREMFLETLVADDDDGNLANGTPHSAAIMTAFSGHGIGPDAWITFTHTPVADAAAGGAVPVVATIRYTGPAVTSLAAGTPTLHYALGRGTFQAAGMVPTGTADQFTASIPAPAGAVVAYYLTTRDANGDEAAWPVGAPTHRVFRFVTGPASPRLTWDMAVDPGWTIGAPGDDATSGIWVRDDPVESANTDTANFVVVQPADDHSATDTRCWMTGNADSMFVPGSNDVDEGRTTLTTATFDALPAGYEHPVIEYWRWYSNNTGSTTDDPWMVDLSNDNGATWVPIERQAVAAASWERVLVRVEDFLPPSHTMRVRFIAADEGTSSLVEAAVDDFRLLAFPSGTVAVDGATALHALEFLPAWPNPSAGDVVLRWRLPAAAAMRLELFDVGGRHVRTLVAGVGAAGEHAIAWDGRDDAGRALPGGLYLARLEAGRDHRVQRLVRVR